MNVACELSALDAAERLRREELAGALRASVAAVAELPDGYAFHFDAQPDTVRRVEELIALERRCCSFLIFETRVDAASGAFVLEMTGGPGVREFINAQFVDGASPGPKEAP